jgi:hypothetical protein
MISCLPIGTTVPAAHAAHYRPRGGDPFDDALSGIGAYVAIKAAARLTPTLVSAHRGERDRVDAIHDYAAAMLD